MAMTVVQKQCLLKYLNYYDGYIDGDWGPKSRAATVALQKDNGIEADGIFGDKTEEIAKSAVFYGKFRTEEKPTVSENYVAKYFRRDEFACKCGKCGGFPAEPSPALLRVLDQIREHFGSPCHVNSGVRCKDHNAAVGGANNSQHLYGTAADIRVDGVAPLTLYKYAETLLPDSGGIGLYSWGIHVDVRKQKARWR